MKAYRVLLLVLAFILTSTVCASAAEQDEPSSGKWRTYVTACLDTLIQRGTDVYGPVKTPMLMSFLDVRTLTSPEHPELNDDEIRTEGRPSHGRRSPGGANLWHDMATLRTMYAISRGSDNSKPGDPKYAEAADAYINAVFTHALKKDPGHEGLLIWGSHSFYNCFKESGGGDGAHEILIHHPEWAEMYRLNPAGTKKEIDQIWQWHIQDKETGRNNRHDSAGTGDFAFSAGSFIIAFSFLYGETKDQDYLDKARLVSDWHWNGVNPETGLMLSAPGRHADNLWNSVHCFTEVSGCHCSQLLRAYEYSGDPIFRDRAIAVIKAYEKYGWDEEGRNYYAALRADDGTPVLEYNPDRAAPVSPYMPIGHVDLWRTIMYTFEFPLVAAQTSIYAYELSGTEGGEKDAELLAIALHWAEVVEKNMPPFLGRRFKKEVEEAMPAVKQTGGTYAENYGRAISFFVHVYRATGNKEYLMLAETLASEAIEKLYVETELTDEQGKTKMYGIFRGHPAKPYYQSNDFVGILLHALLELDTPDQHFRGAF